MFDKYTGAEIRFTLAVRVQVLTLRDLAFVKWVQVVTSGYEWLLVVTSGY